MTSFSHDWTRSVGRFPWPHIKLMHARRMGTGFTCINAPLDFAHLEESGLARIKGPDDAQRVSGILQLEQAGALASHDVGLVQHHHELTIEPLEDHAVSAVIGKEWLGLVRPRAAQLARSGN